MEEKSKKLNTRFKNPAEKRAEKMKIALNSEEKSQLILNAEALNYSSLAEFIRDSGLKSIDEKLMKTNKKELLSKISELKKIGNNINQIAKYCHANKKPADKFVELVAENLQKEIANLSNLLRKK